MNVALACVAGVLGSDGVVSGIANLIPGNASSQLRVCVPAATNASGGLQRVYRGTHVRVAANSSVSVIVAGAPYVPACQRTLDPFEDATSCTASSALAGTGASVERALPLGAEIRASALA